MENEENRKKSTLVYQAESKTQLADIASLSAYMLCKYFVLELEENASSVISSSIFSSCINIAGKESSIMVS